MLSAILEYKVSQKAVSIREAENIIKVAVKDFLINRISYAQMRKSLRFAASIVPKQYKKQVEIFAKLYLRNYLHELFGISLVYFFSFYNRHQQSQIDRLPVYKKRYSQSNAHYLHKLKQSTETMIAGNLSVRSLAADAEAVDMYERQMEQIKECKAAGYNLIVCSSHADCSELCLPYQGKVYSLDGTSGRTKEGYSYEPLENAMGPTKLCHKWCKHTFSPYIGEFPPHLTQEEQERESAITHNQRVLERKCRYHYDRLIRWEGIDECRATHYQHSYNDAVKEYNAFCEKNNRVPIINKIN